MSHKALCDMVLAMKVVTQARVRRMTVKAAWDCEQGIEGRCRCRCEGKLHGKRRTKVAADDPHAPAFYCLECGQTRVKPGPN